MVGAGSLSFQMIEALVERLPVMVCPRWVATLTQPMAVDDVVAYLAGALELPDNGSEVFEIGGPDVVSYGDIMREYAQLRGLRRWLLPVPLLTPDLSGLWLALVTPAQARVGRALVEGLKNPTVVRSSAALDAFQIEPTPLRVALATAIEAGARSRQKVDTRTMVVDAPPSQVFVPIRQIGGTTARVLVRPPCCARMDVQRSPAGDRESRPATQSGTRRRGGGAPGYRGLTERFVSQSGTDDYRENDAESEVVLAQACCWPSRGPIHEST